MCVRTSLFDEAGIVSRDELVFISLHTFVNSVCIPCVQIAYMMCIVGVCMCVYKKNVETTASHAHDKHMLCIRCVHRLHVCAIYAHDVHLTWNELRV